jgi:hypothetical protein
MRFSASGLLSHFQLFVTWRKHAPSAKKISEKESAVEKEKTVSNFAHGNVEEHYDAFNVKERSD